MADFEILFGRDNIYNNFLVDALDLMTLLSWYGLLVYLQAESVAREADKGGYEIVMKATTSLLYQIATAVTLTLTSKRALTSI